MPLPCTARNQVRWPLDRIAPVQRLSACRPDRLAERAMIASEPLSALFRFFLIG